VWKTRRESTHDNDDYNRIKEEANADAFSFDFPHYQSWKSIFQMLEMSSFVIWWRMSVDDMIGNE
jgi:hypothetical protein